MCGNRKTVLGLAMMIKAGYLQRVFIYAETNNIVIVPLFAKLPWPGGRKGTFRSSSHAATCPSSTTHGGGFTLSFLLLSV